MIIRARRVVALLCAAVLLGACASRAAVTAADRVRVPLPSPATIAGHGVTFHVERVSPAGAAASARHMVTVYLMAQDNPNPLCATLRPSVRLVREDDRAVVVAAFAYQHRSRRKGSVFCAYESDRTVSLYRPFVVNLSAPLRHRVLLDARTGKRVAIVSGRPPAAPLYVPSGYRETSVQAFTTDFFLGLRQYSLGGDSMTATASISIRVQPETEWARSGTVAGHATIAGHDATLYDEKAEHCWSWTASAVVTAVCSQSSGDHFLSAAELKRVAESLQ